MGNFGVTNDDNVGFLTALGFQYTHTADTQTGTSRRYAMLNLINNSNVFLLNSIESYFTGMNVEYVYITFLVTTVLRPPPSSNLRWHV